jgi:hypothetical protein
MVLKAGYKYRNRHTNTVWKVLETSGDAYVRSVCIHSGIPPMRSIGEVAFMFNSPLSKDWILIGKKDDKPLWL